MLPITKLLPKGSHYLAVDMDRSFLKKTIAQVAATNPGITSAGIQSSFQHFPEILGLIEGPKLIISFGSNLLNHPEPMEQMRPIAEKMDSGDRIYLSIDCHGMKEEEKVTETYKCPEFMKFIEGTLQCLEGYKAEQWDLSSELRVAPAARYSFTLTAKEDVRIRDELYPKDSSIEFFPCYKSSEPAVNVIASELGMWIVGYVHLPNSKMCTQFSPPPRISPRANTERRPFPYREVLGSMNQSRPGADASVSVYHDFAFRDLAGGSAPRTGFPPLQSGLVMSYGN